MCKLDGATLVSEMKKPFDFSAEGLPRRENRGNEMAFELFWQATRVGKSGSDSPKGCRMTCNRRNQLKSGGCVLNR
jgi:hypothetical protein